MPDPQDPFDGAPDAATPPATAPATPPVAPPVTPPVKKAAAKKVPAKKAPAKKAPAKRVEPVESIAVDPPRQVLRVETNGQLAEAAKDAAAQAKTAVDVAGAPVALDAVPRSSSRVPVPVVCAVSISLLAVLLIRRLRRGSAKES